MAACLSPAWQLPRLLFCLASADSACLALRSRCACTQALLHHDGDMRLQVEVLTSKHHIYLTKDGRISMAGEDYKSRMQPLFA